MKRLVNSVVLRWETLLVVLIIAAMLWSASLSPYYFYLDQILSSTRFMVVFGLMALGLMVVVIQGEIDISVCSSMAVATVTLARLNLAGWSLPLALLATVTLCAVLGLINGILVARWKLPSLAVTLGTLGAYRGLAYIIGGNEGYSNLPDSWTRLGAGYWGIVPISLVLLLVAAGVFGVLLGHTVYGRQTYATGTNALASSYGGVPVVRVKITAYVIAGVMAGLAGLVWIGQYGSARADNADGGILFVLTAVVLGGVSINGGTGKVFGLLLSLFLLGTLQNGMGLANVAGPTRTLVLGAMLIASIAIPALSRKRRPRPRAPVGGAPTAGDPPGQDPSPPDHALSTSRLSDPGPHSTAH